MTNFYFSYIVKSVGRKHTEEGSCVLLPTDDEVVETVICRLHPKTQFQHPHYMTLILKTTEWKSCCVQRSPARSLVRSDAAEQTRNHGAQQDPLERLTERTGTVPVSDHFVSHFQRQWADLSSPAGGHRVAVSVRNLTGEVEERGESWSEPQLPKNARRGGVKSARRRDESTLDGHYLNDFVFARLNICCGIFGGGNVAGARCVKKQTNTRTACMSHAVTFLQGDC